MRARGWIAVLDAVLLGAALVAYGAYQQSTPVPHAGDETTATTGATAATTTTTTAAPVPRPVAVGLLALRPGDVAATNPSRYRVVILNAWEWRRIAALKSSHPDTTVLVYKDMASTRSYAVDDAGADDALLPTGVGYAAASKTHPDWFLTDNRHARVEWQGYSDHWWMDVGNPDYTAAWLASVRSEVRLHGWDGVLVDNAIVDPAVYLRSGRHLAAYPTAQAYQAATEAFLNAVAPALREDDKIVVANLGGAAPPIDLYQRWAAAAGGIMREHFARGGADGKGDLVSGDAWRVQAAQQDAAAAAGATYLAVTYAASGDEQTLGYARASFLLGWHGDAHGALLVTSPNPRADPWSPTWTADVGTPLGERRAVGAAWVREFTDGLVAVNPTASPVELELGGTYLDESDKPVTARALAPQTGAVMRRAPR